MAETVFQLVRVPDQGFHLVGPNIDLGTDPALAAFSIGATRASIGVADGYRLIVDGVPVEMLPATMQEDQVEEAAVRLALQIFKPVHVSRAFFSSGGRIVYERMFHVEVMDPWQAVNKYALATDKEICKMLRIPVQKATNPKKSSGFLRIVNKLRKELGEDMADLEDLHLMGMIELLGTADLTALSGAEATAFYSSVASGSIPGTAIQSRMPKWNTLFKQYGEDIFGKTKVSEIKDFKFGVDTSLSLLDLSAVDRMANDQVNFIRNQFGVRSQALTMQARNIVREGMAQGLDSVSIGKEIESRLTGLYERAGKNYAEVVASAFVGRARSWSSINTYREAGVKKSRIVAVLDEVTTEFCEMHDGVIIDVELAWQKYEQESQLQDPEDIKFSSPWVHGRNEADGSRTLGFYDKAHNWTALYKAPNVQDEFKPLFSEDEFQVVGIGPPPYHGRCRTDIQPEIETLADSRTVTREVDIAPPVPPPTTAPTGSYKFPASPADWFDRAKGVPLDRNLYGGDPMKAVQGMQAYMERLHPGIAQVAKVDASAIGLRSKAQGYVAQTYLMKDGTLKIGSSDKLWQYMLGHTDQKPFTMDAIYKGINPLIHRDWSAIAKDDRKAMGMFSDMFGARAARSMASNMGAPVKDKVFAKFLGKNNLYGLHEALKHGSWFSELRTADPKEWTGFGASAIREWFQSGKGYGGTVLPDQNLRSSWFNAMLDKAKTTADNHKWFNFAAACKPTRLRNEDFLEFFGKATGIQINLLARNGTIFPMKDLLKDVGKLHLDKPFLQGGDTWKQSMASYLKQRAEVRTAIEKLVDERGTVQAMRELRKAIEERTKQVGSANFTLKAEANRPKKYARAEHRKLFGADLSKAQAHVSGWDKDIKKLVSKELCPNNVTCPFHQYQGRGYYSHSGSIHFDLLKKAKNTQTAWHETGHFISYQGGTADFNVLPFRLMMRDKIGDSTAVHKLWNYKSIRINGTDCYEWYHKPLPGKDLFDKYCAKEYSIDRAWRTNATMDAWTKKEWMRTPGQIGFSETTSMALQQFVDEYTMKTLYAKDPDYFTTAYIWLMGGYKQT